MVFLFPEESSATTYDFPRKEELEKWNLGLPETSWDYAEIMHHTVVWDSSLKSTQNKDFLPKFVAKSCAMFPKTN